MPNSSLQGKKVQVSASLLAEEKKCTCMLYVYNAL
jgi:hypothetical protein